MSDRRYHDFTPIHFDPSQIGMRIDSAANIHLFPIERSSEATAHEDSMIESPAIDVASASNEQNKSFTFSRRGLMKAGAIAMGGYVFVETMKYSYDSGRRDQENETVEPKIHFVTQEEAKEAKMDHEQALLSIFRKEYPNVLNRDEEIITWVINGGIVNVTAVEQERQTNTLEAKDELQVKFPEINFKG